MKKIETATSLAAGFSFLTATNQASAANENSAPVMSTLVSLFIVLAIIGVIAVVVKRLRLAGVADPRLMRVVSQLPLSAKEKISIIEIENQWLIVGVTAHQITLLTKVARKDGIASAPEPDNFAKLFNLARGKSEKA